MDTIQVKDPGGCQKINAIPAIGLTTQVVRTSKWYKEVDALGFQTIEINRRNSKLHFNPYFLEKVNRYMKGYDLSIHSGASGIFQPIESFTQANLAVLTAEIDICKMLGVNQFVFHLNDGILSPENKKRLRAVVAHATDRGVQMLYESNSVLVAEDAYDILESFPQLGYVLDLGHLNNGYGCGKLGCEISEFIHQVRNRVIYIHASNNYGKHDEHNSLDDGNLDWRNVLDQLKMSNISKIIIEVKELGMVESSRRALCDYFQTRQGLKPKRTAVDHNTAIQEAVPGL